MQKYICSSCQSEFKRWSGRCPDCSSWNSLGEKSSGQATRIIKLAELSGIRIERQSSGLPDLDRLLGGGFVPGSLVLLAGEPGAGKSTLLLEIARNLREAALYFSGEESLQQIGERALRLNLDKAPLNFVQAHSLREIKAHAPSCRILFIDSIQTIASADQPAGTQSAMRQVTQELMLLARSHNITIIMTGHITREGSIAGPRLIEHMVDTVLFFESDRFNRLRILRSIKNRFGRTGEVAFFMHYEHGLSVLALPEVELSFQNSIIGAIVQGSRAIPVEVQALVSEQGNGRRTAEGLDQKRLALLAAVLNRHLLPDLAGHDIFVNLAGGLSSDEVALDLSLCAAVFASATGQSLKCAFLGEVGLGGEIRTVSAVAERVQALHGCGIKKIFVPARQVEDRDSLVGIEHICQLKEILNTLRRSA